MSPAERNQPVSEPASASRRVLLAAAALAVAGSASAQTNDPGQLAAIIEAYAAALRSNNVEALVALYATNGVFMREDLPAVVGIEALRASYQKVFATLKVDLRFNIQEIEMAGDLAWLRSTSKGRIKTLASGLEADESFNGLFVFRREGGTWKIRCYLYASNKPGPATPQ
jgi:ketosteroid isomerase-like protein